MTPPPALSATPGRGPALTILVLATARDPHRQAEALRAALGLTLRGARVEVAIEATGDAGDVAQALATPLARRAAETLRSFGHPVGIVAGEALAAALARAGRVEVWT